MAHFPDQPVLALWAERLIGGLRLRSTVWLGLDRLIVGRGRWRLLRAAENYETHHDQEGETQGPAGFMHISSSCQKLYSEMCGSPTGGASQLDAATGGLSPPRSMRKFAPGSANGRNPSMISTHMKTKSMMATPGKRIRLKDFDPAFKGGYASHAHAQSKLKANVQRLAKYQDLLYS